MTAPVIAIAVTLRIDHLDVRTKILTRITIGIKVRISVGQPKRNDDILSIIRTSVKSKALKQLAITLISLELLLQWIC